MGLYLSVLVMLLTGMIGLRWSHDFTPSVFHIVIGLGIGVLVFLRLRGRVLAGKSKYNPTTVGFMGALIALVMWASPVGKAFTVIFGSSVQVAGTAESYHERGRRRGANGGCRRATDVRLADGASVDVCGPQLPPGLDLEVRVRRSVFGRYSEQRYGQVDIEGMGSLDSVVQKAEQAQNAADKAAARASKTDR